MQCIGYKNQTAQEEINDFLNKWIKKIPELYKIKKQLETIDMDTALLQKGYGNQYDIRLNHS